MTVITNEQNLGPEILVQAVLGFDRCEIVASRDDAIVDHDEIVLTLIKHYILATSANAIAGEGDKKINCHMAADASFHGSGTKLLPLRGGGCYL